MEAFKKVMKHWIIPFTLEILVMLLVIQYVFFLAVVPTGSMLPTVAEGSWLFATRLYNPEKNVERGDVIVFRSDELDETLLKRCIGLPGDTILIEEDGRLLVNGSELQEPYVRFQGNLSGNFFVPEGCFLFLGDNRLDSLDARYWDNPYITADKLMGKARFTLWPLHNFGVLD